MPSSPTYAYRQFQAHAQGFCWQGEDFGFDQITHLFFSWGARGRDGRRSYRSEAATLRITVNAGETIVLNFKSRSGRPSENIANLRHLYVHLSYQSFPHRLERYKREVKERGYFSYEGYQFHPPGKIVRRSQEFPVRATKFRKGPGYVELRKKQLTFLDLLKREYCPRFNTQNDTDVIFHLLNEEFGLRWKE
jgi:hypothetical protein